MTSIDQIRSALSKMHKRACGDASQVYMSIPADFTKDADLILSSAIDELAAARSALAHVASCLDEGEEIDMDLIRPAIDRVGS